AERSGSDSESNSVHARDDSRDLETDKVPRPKQRLRRTGVAFTSDELAAMSKEELVQSLKDAQRGDISGCDEPRRGSRGLTATDQPSATVNAPAALSHNISKQELKNIVEKHCRQSFLTLTGRKDGRMCPTVRDSKGFIEYWTPNEHNIKEFTLAWENGFEENVKVWGPEFLRQCRVELEMPPLGREYLKTAPDVFINTLENGAWKTYPGFAKQEVRGMFEQSRDAKRFNNRGNERKNTKAAQRTKASRGTCIDSKLSEFKFLYQPRAQLPPIRDLNDSDREIVLVPFFVSGELTRSHRLQRMEVTELNGGKNLEAHCFISDGAAIIQVLSVLQIFGHVFRFADTIIG
ncbi:hypothetical protein FRC11_005269, partial [Ceratobasidium sp. 423]